MAAHVSDTTSTRQPGRFGRALIRMLMKQAHVVEVEPIAKDFRLMTLESPEFRGLSWTPGQKMQIAMGSAFVARTFTPIEWDAAKGRTRILGYAHGDGPGSAWIGNVRPGDACDVFGPRASLDVSAASGMRVVFGDETSIGLAYALSRHAPRKPLQSVFEVNNVADTSTVLTQLHLDEVELFERRPGDTQLDEIERRLPTFVANDASFVLTGKAPSIQRLRRAIKALDVPTPRILTKPYWAPGKTGLD